MIELTIVVLILAVIALTAWCMVLHTRADQKTQYANRLLRERDEERHNSQIKIDKLTAHLKTERALFKVRNVD